MKFLLLLILIIIFFKAMRSSFQSSNRKIKKTKEGKNIEFQDAEYKEID